MPFFFINDGVVFRDNNSLRYLPAIQTSGIHQIIEMCTKYNFVEIV